VAKKQIVRLKTPSLRLVDLVTEELRKIISSAVLQVEERGSLVSPPPALHCVSSSVWGNSKEEENKAERSHIFMDNSLNSFSIQYCGSGSEDGKIQRGARGQIRDPG
jgi:hypothetical protein